MLERFPLLRVSVLVGHRSSPVTRNRSSALPIVVHEAHNPGAALLSHRYGQRADDLEVGDRVALVQHDAATYVTDGDEQFDLVSCSGATWINDGLVGTLELMRPRARFDALVVVGAARIDRSVTSARGPASVVSPG